MIRKDSLKDLLGEARTAGLDRALRHEMAERYRSAGAEFRFHITPPTREEFKTTYRRAEEIHCAKKARGYIARHTKEGEEEQ